MTHITKKEYEVKGGNDREKLSKENGHEAGM